MGLLELERVSKRYRDGARVALDDVSLVIDRGEMVVVWGERRSGRSTLLRVAAGVELPDAGIVRFAGRELARPGAGMRGGQVSFCRRTFSSSSGQTVLDHLVAAQLARRVARSAATQRAWSALERVGVQACGSLRPGELDVGEVVRVAVARGLCSEPRLLVIDEPTIGVEPDERDDILALLRSLANEHIAVLASTGEGTGMLGADRVLSLGNGRLRGDLVPRLAPVAPLRALGRTSS